MKVSIAGLCLLALAACSSPPAPAPVVAPEPVAVAAAPADLGSVRVTASAVNVRRDPSTDSAVLTQAKKNDKLTLLATTDDWSKVRLADGTIGWVASRFVGAEGAAAQPSRSSSSKRSGCDTDFAFVKTPTPSFSDNPSKHGLVVVDAYVSANGDVTSTKVISNDTGESSLAELAQREIRSAKFVAPKRGCVARAFIFTYKRSF